jgi:hypothetical protein
MSIKVYPASTLHAAVNADASKVLVIEKKKDEKLYRGTRFLNVYVNVGSELKKELWVAIEDVELTIGVADPSNAEDKRNEFEGTRLQLQTTVSRCGDFGQFLMKLNPYWKSQVERLAKEGLVNLNGRRVHDLLQLNLSESNQKNPNGVIEDPVIRFKVDFSTFPPRYKHRFLVGQPRTQFFDYRTAYADEKGVTQYKPAMVTDPISGEMVPVTAANLHLFATKGSIIRRGRVMIPSVAISQSWVSIPINIARAVIEPAAESGFSDEFPTGTPMITMAEMPVAPMAVPMAAPTMLLTASPTTPDPVAADGDEISQVLNAITMDV